MGIKWNFKVDFGNVGFSYTIFFIKNRHANIVIFMLNLCAEW